MIVSLLKKDGFLDKVVLSLLPYFTAAVPDPRNARDTIVKALMAYAIRTEAEILEAAQIVAYSFTALDNMGEAATPGVSLPMRLRLCGQTSALNRSKRQCQTALADSLCQDVPEKVPGPEPLRSEPDSIHTVLIQPASTPEADQHSAAPNPPAEPPRIAAPTQPTAGPNLPSAASASRHSGVSTVAMLQGLAGARMPRGIMAPRPSVIHMTAEKQKNNAIWASVMGQVIKELVPNALPMT